MNRNKKAWGALVTAALLGVSLAASAQTRKDVHDDRKEVREDRKEKHEDRKELREDKRELHEDAKDGASAKELRDDKKELADDRKELRGDRQEVRKARRKEIHDKWGETVKKPEAKAELKVHGRRIARLVRARKVADEMGKKELVARIDKLIEKEKARHQGSMEKLKGAP
jgi:uncharacterized protein HemX